jgi:hypothetical protein
VKKRLVSRVSLAPPAAAMPAFRPVESSARARGSEDRDGGRSKERSGSRWAGGAMYASGRSPRRSRLASSVESRTSFLTRRVSQCNPSGCTRCTCVQLAWSKSAARRCSPEPPPGPVRPWPPPSRTRPGRSPPAPRRAPGSSAMRTITDRRRCKSIPTYCRYCCTWVSFRRCRVGWETPSVVAALGSGRREETRRSGLAVAIGFVLQTAAPARTTRAHHAEAALRFFMTSGRIAHRRRRR